MGAVSFMSTPVVMSTLYALRKHFLDLLFYKVCCTMQLILLCLKNLSLLLSCTGCQRVSEVHSNKTLDHYDALAILSSGHNLQLELPTSLQCRQNTSLPIEDDFCGIAASILA